MTINIEKNKKTQTVKNTLTMLLLFLKALETNMVRIDSHVLHGWALSIYQKEIRKLKEGIKILEEIQFKSVDDLDSVRKLREAELYFSKNDLLRAFTFSNYTSQISPDFLIYADIEINLNALLKKSDDLFFRSHKLAGYEVKSIVSSLRDLNHTYFKKRRINLYDYKSRVLDILNQARPVLEQHRGYKKLLGNLVLLLLTLGTVFIINKAVNGQFLFFQKTDSAQKLDDLTQTVSQLSLS